MDGGSPMEYYQVLALTAAIVMHSESSKASVNWDEKLAKRCVGFARMIVEAAAAEQKGR